MPETTRYARQTILTEIGPQGQERLARARILVIGAGGLGCPALAYLAGAGVGTLGIVDFDRVDTGNLQRQILFTTADRGLAKVHAARERLSALNPDIRILAYETALRAANAEDLFAAYDIVIDGTDTLAAKALLGDAGVKTGKPLVHGAIQGFEGRVSVFGFAGGPCYRCLYPQPPKAAILNCAQSGVIGALPGIVGSIQAMEAIKIAVGHPSFEPLSGRLWMIDARTMETQTLKIPRRADCPSCACEPHDILLRDGLNACAAHTDIPDVDCTGPMPGDPLFIDVREREEWEQGHIEGALHWPLSALMQDAGAFTRTDPDRPAILYCRVGIRSRRAAALLAAAGHHKLYNLAGGYEAWRMAHKNA